MRFSLTVVAAALLPLTFAAPALSIPGVNIANAAVANAVPNTYIVVYKPDAKAADILAHEQKAKGLLSKIASASSYKGVGNRFNMPGLSGYVVHTSKAGLASIGGDKVIKYVELDSIVKLDIKSPNNITNLDSPSATAVLQWPQSTWGLARISHRMKQVYGYLFEDSECLGSRTYVIDTGIRTTHTEFQGRAVWGANFVPGSPNTDEAGHGTHCAGTIAGYHAGVCLKGTVVAVKVLDATGSGQWSWVIAGMNWALADAKAKGMVKKSVVSMSLGGTFNAAVNQAATAMYNGGMTVVVAAGNSGDNACNYSPASAVGAITVAATDSMDTRPTWSNYGSCVNLHAPGVSIFSAWNSCDTCYNIIDGTSMATPHVAGLSAYFIIRNKLTTPSAVLAKINAWTTNGKVIGANGSPNRIAYNANGA